MNDPLQPPTRPSQASEPYFRRLEDSLREPTKAALGDPCTICGEPIARSVAVWRDRHVCSSRCNSLKIRRWKAKIRRGEITPVVDEREQQQIDDEAARDPRLFATVRDAEFPYEHARWPKIGDIIERHGHATQIWDPADLAYSAEHIAHLEAKLPDSNPTRASRWRAAVHLESGVWAPFTVDDAGRPTNVDYRTLIHRHLPLRIFGQQLLPVPAGVPAVSRELISDVDQHGYEYRWEVWLFTPTGPLDLWTPARQALSDSRARATRAHGSYLARMRALGIDTGDTERIDPHDIYTAAQWTCGICGTPIDPDLAWPDPRSITLDHIVPLTRGGAHQRHNLQPAHWLCNLTKGNS